MGKAVNPDGTNLKELILFLAERGIHFVIGGGVAVVLHGVERMTMDLDIALEWTPHNLATFLEAISEIGMKPRAPVPAKLLFDQVALERLVAEKHAVVFSFVDVNNPIRQVDVFITEENAYENLLRESVSIDFDGQKVYILSVEKLIEMKRALDAPREEDLSDIRELSLLVRKNENGCGL